MAGFLQILNPLLYLFFSISPMLALHIFEKIGKKRLVQSVVRRNSFAAVFFM